MNYFEQIISDALRRRMIKKAIYEGNQRSQEEEIRREVRRRLRSMNPVDRRRIEDDMLRRGISPRLDDAEERYIEKLQWENSRSIDHPSSGNDYNRLYSGGYEDRVTPQSPQSTIQRQPQWQSQSNQFISLMTNPNNSGPYVNDYFPRVSQSPIANGTYTPGGYQSRPTPTRLQRGNQELNNIQNSYKPLPPGTTPNNPYPTKRGIRALQPVFNPDSSIFD